MLRFSNRAIDLHTSPIRQLMPLASKAKKNGRKIYHLNIGQPDIPTPDIFFNAIKNYDHKVLEYVDSQGMPNTIESFINYYKQWGIDFEQDEIVVTNGGSEALLFAIMSVADYGEEVLIPEPFYTNYFAFTSMAGVNVVSFLTEAEKGFHLPSKDIVEKSISAKTRAILLSNPGNPTGVVYTKKELEMICDIALEHNLFIISDEVYREFIYDGLEHISFMEVPKVWDRVILVDSISKRYSACGARIGLVASKNKELMKLLLKFGQSRLCVAELEQIGAAALINTPDKYFYEVKAEYQKRRDVVYESLKNTEGVICQKPQGAFYIMAKLPIDDTEDFVKFLLSDFHIDNETVMLAPAQGFYCSPHLGKDEVRISYCLNTESLKKAMNIFNKGLQEYKSKKRK